MQKEPATHISVACLQSLHKEREQARAEVQSSWDRNVALRFTQTNIWPGGGSW